MNNLYLLYIIPLLVFILLMLLTMPPFSCCLEEKIPCPIYRAFSIAIIVSSLSFIGAALVVYHLL